MKNIRNKTGSLMLALVVILVLTILSAALFLISVNDGFTAQRQRMQTQAFHIAEAGIERAIYELRQDFINYPPPSWSDGNINGWVVDVGSGYHPFPKPDIVSNPTYYTVFVPSAQINSGSYSLEIENVTTDAIWVQSTGQYKGETAKIRIYAKIKHYSAWSNAIFAGAGGAGQVINGNVDIRGSVHILGNGLADGDLAVDLGGTADLIGNNYKGLDPALAAKVPALPTTVVEGETVSTLFAELRVKKGIVRLDGAASAGQPQKTQAQGDNDFIKEKIDGSYVTDGFDGSGGTDNVHSDNDYSNPYDLGDAIRFPSLSDPYGGTTFQQWFQNQAFVVSLPADLDQLKNITTASAFNIGNAVNGLTMVARSKTLQIRGKVYIDDPDGAASTRGDLFFNDKNKIISYTGTGAILTEGNVQIDTNLLTSGSFPTNIMAIMTPQTITLGTTAQAKIMGLFYGEQKVKVEKQTVILGTIVTNYFDLGSQVPNIYQVPETSNHLPAGLIGTEPVCVMNIISWQRL